VRDVINVLKASIHMREASVNNSINPYILDALNLYHICLIGLFVLLVLTRI